MLSSFFGRAIVWSSCVFIVAKQLPISRRRSAANTFMWSQIAKIQDFVRTVGMGNGIPIKIARNQNPQSGFWVTWANLALVSAIGKITIRACYTVIMSSHSGHTVQPFRCGKQQCLDHERLFIWVRCDRLFRMYYQLRHCKISVLTGILLQVLHTSAISRLLRWLRSEVSILFCNP